MNFKYLYEKYPPKKNYELILDSGAFTAWTKKVAIDIDSYAMFLKKYEPYVTSYVNLDVIPAEFGRHPTVEEVEHSAQQGWNNLLHMEKFGLSPIHVFHQDEDLKWLGKLIETGHTYIGISPANDRTTEEKIKWLDQVFEFITDNNGNPIVKTHGFAVTAVPLLVRYPFYSCDSASWVRTASYGFVYVPMSTGGVLDYSKSPYRVAISEKSPRQFEDGMHYLNVPEVVKNELNQYFNLKGFSFEQLVSEYKKRDRINIMYFNDLESNLPCKGFDRSLIKSGFFSKSLKLVSENIGTPMKTKLYLATAFCDLRNFELTVANNRRRLVSYFYHKQGNVHEDYIPKFVKQGYGDKKEKGCEE